MTSRFRFHYIRLFLILMTFTFVSRAQTFEGSHLSGTTFPYPMPPFVYENNQMVSVTFKTSPDVLRELVPEPLVINPDSLITVYIGMLNIVEPEQIPYFEAAIMIPASYGDIQGNYMPVLYLDKSLPIIIGREIWGFPKFHADFSMEIKDSVVHASVRRAGTTLIEITLKLGKSVSPAPSSTSSVILMKLIPSVKGGSTYDVKQLTTALVRESKAIEVNRGEAKLSLGSTVSDPLGMIPVLKVIGSVYTIGGFVLDYGQVIYDYLSQ